MNSPFLSIITVTLNNLNNLKKTISSIKEQSFKDFEIIVIDGDSSDGTKEYLFENISSITKYISEKDMGIYDAMNKGISIASGKYVHFLNAGDNYFDSVSLEQIYYNVLDSPEIFYTNVELNFKNKKVVKRYADDLDILFLYSDMVCHQATFYSLYYIQNNYYKTQYKVCADYYILLNIIIKDKIKPKHIDIVGVSYLTGGYSEKNINFYIKEKKEIQNFFFTKNENYILDRYFYLNHELLMIKKSFLYKLYIYFFILIPNFLKKL